MAETRQGYYHLYGVDGAITFTSGPASYATPLLQSMRLTHSGEERQFRNSDGVVVGAVYPDDWVMEMTFEFVPAAATDVAAATAGLPYVGQLVTTSGMPVIQMGSLADALNGKWIYVSGGINTTNDGAATGTMTLKKYKSITAA